MASLNKKATRILKETFPPPDKVKLEDEDQIIGTVVSSKFIGLDSPERLDLLWDVLNKKLTPKERNGILMILAVAPTEEVAQTSG